MGQAYEPRQRVVCSVYISEHNRLNYAVKNTPWISQPTHFLKMSIGCIKFHQTMVDVTFKKK